MIDMLIDLLREKKCFKLVCGAGNEDAVEVRKLVALYSKAGCNVFDLCAKPEIVDAAKNGLEFAGIEDDRYLCVSVGIKGDPHVCKARINQESCIHCGRCLAICSRWAIIESQKLFSTNSKRCIGCGKCLKACPEHCIEMVHEPKDLKDILPVIIDKGIDCVEFHVLGEDESEVDEKWNDINNLYNGPLSICIDRSVLGNDGVLKRVKRMLRSRKPYTTIIQADGAPMSGGKDDYKTTLQTVAMAEVFQNEQLPVYLLLSGGTNSKTTELAKLCAIDANGVAIGTYARQIVSEYIGRDDFLENEEIFNKALKIAKNLVDISLKHLG